jgi:hypothetical protein
MFLNKTIFGLTFTHQSKVHLLSPIKNKLFILKLYFEIYSQLDGLEIKLMFFYWPVSI